MPRGDLPLLDHPLQAHPSLPHLYKKRRAEYEELLRRGATPAMCGTFQLEFFKDSGIVAGANEDLMEEFGGEAMEGCRWKIYLGRRVQLEEEDLDGTMCLEGLLEDALYFCPPTDRWITMRSKKYEDVWVTMPPMWLVQGEEDETEDVKDERAFKLDDGEIDPEWSHYADGRPIRKNRYDPEDDEDSDAEDESDGDSAGEGSIPQPGPPIDERGEATYGARAGAEEEEDDDDGYSNTTIAEYTDKEDEWGWEPTFEVGIALDPIEEDNAYDTPSSEEDEAGPSA